MTLFGPTQSGGFALLRSYLTFTEKEKKKKGFHLFPKSAYPALR